MSFLPLKTAVTVLTLLDPSTLTPRLGGWHRLEITSDVNNYLRMAPSELDLAFPTVTSGFRLTIPSGANALAATDINLFAASAPVAKSWSNTATEIARAINAAIGAGTVTCTWSGSTTGGTTGAFVITAPGATAITVAAHSTGWDMTAQLFGGTTDQDAVATTWTGAAPRDLTRTGPGWIRTVLKGALTYGTGMPYASSATPMRDALGNLLTSIADRMILLRAKEGYASPGGALQGYNYAGLFASDVSNISGNARGVEQSFLTSGSTRQPSPTYIAAGVWAAGGLMNISVRTRSEALLQISGAGATRRMLSSVCNSFSEATALPVAAASQLVNTTPAGDSLYPLITWRRGNVAETKDAELCNQYGYTISTGTSVELTP